MQTAEEPDGTWIEVWKGADESQLQALGRKLDAEGIPMRRAWDGTYCTTGGGISLLSLFRRKRNNRLLVPEEQSERARTIIKA